MKDIICWWSGGITSAVACKIALDLFKNKNKCRVIMIDTINEDSDTYRFKRDCEKWYNQPIEVISGIKPEIDFCANNKPNYTYIDTGYDYPSIKDVWEKHVSLNVATGAICSTQLKRRVREKWQEQNKYDYQVFGFEFDRKEFLRAFGMTTNHAKARAIYPLLLLGYNKEDCLRIVQEAGIKIPRMYQLGFKNNNCFKTGCVQGGIGYWQKMKRDFPDKFNNMADMEHKLTDLKGSPVTMLKSQKAEDKNKVKTSGAKWMQYVFLKEHPNYPELKTISDFPELEVKPLVDCNGFCGVNDFIVKDVNDKDINYI